MLEKANPDLRWTDGLRALMRVPGRHGAADHSAAPLRTSNFLNDAFLAAHIESRHAPRPPKPKAAHDGPAAVELVRTTIADRIGNGELKAGQTIKQGGLADELGVTRSRMETAVGSLVAQVVLGYAGVGHSRRAIVIG